MKTVTSKIQQRFIILPLLLLISLLNVGWKTQFKIVELKNFTTANGVVISQDFVNSFYDGMREFIPKAKIADQVVSEGAVVSDADAKDAAIIEGTFTEYEKSGKWSGGWITMEANVYRMSDHTLIKTITQRSQTMHRGLTSDTSADKYEGQMTGGNFALWIGKNLHNSGVGGNSATNAQQERQQFQSGNSATNAQRERQQFQSGNSEVLTNNSIVELVKDGVSEEIIISMIKNQPTKFDVGVGGVLLLKSNSVSETIINEMVVRGHGAIEAPATSVITSDPAVEKLCESLKQDNPGKVIAALKKLRNMKATEAAPNILPCLMDSNPNVVREACRTIAIIGNKDVIPAIEPLLTNSRSDIRGEAYKAITKLRAKP